MTAQEAKMTAEKARELATSITETKAARELLSIENEIERVAKLGNFSLTTYNTSMMSQVRTELEKRGFKVRQDYDPRDSDSWTTISWTN